MSLKCISYEQYDDTVIVRTKSGIMPRHRWTRYGHYAFRLTEEGKLIYLPNKENRKALIGIGIYFLALLIILGIVMIYSSGIAPLETFKDLLYVALIIVAVFGSTYLIHLINISKAREYLKNNLDIYKN